MLNKSNDKYRKLVELANSIILRMDTCGKITYLNRYGLNFFGYKKNDIIGKNLIGIIAPVIESSGRDITNLIESIQKYPKKYPVNENENIRKNGSRVWVLWTNKGIYDAHGRVTEILSIGSEITAKKEYEKALLTSREELERKVHERTLDLKKAYDDLLYEITERKVGEEALRESEIKYGKYGDTILNSRLILNHSSVKSSILNGFCDMRGGNIGSSFKVGDGAGHFDNPGVGTDA